MYKTKIKKIPSTPAQNSNSKYVVKYQNCLTHYIHNFTFMKILRVSDDTSQLIITRLKERYVMLKISLKHC